MAESVIQSPESVWSWPLSAGRFSDVGPRSLSAPYWPVWVRVILARSKSENLEGGGVQTAVLPPGQGRHYGVGELMVKSISSWRSQSLLPGVGSLAILALGPPRPEFRQGGRIFTGFIFVLTKQALCGVRH